MLSAALRNSRVRFRSSCVSHEFSLREVTPFGFARALCQLSLQEITLDHDIGRNAPIIMMLPICALALIKRVARKPALEEESGPRGGFRFDLRPAKVRSDR